MRKTISILLTFVIAFSISCSVFAASDQISDINNGWYWPTSSSIRTITSEFGRVRTDSIHQAIDIDGSEGDPVYATRAGDVVETFNSCKGSHHSDYNDCSCSGGKYYGNYIVVYHGTWNGHKIYSMYMHLKSVSVNVGASVEEGQEIGKIGNTGPSQGSHLHFQISKGSKNPSHKNITEAKNNYINTNPAKSMFTNKTFSHNRIGSDSYPYSEYGNIVYIMNGVDSSKTSNASQNASHTCSKYETYKNGSTKILGACKECHKKFDYSKIYTGDVAGLWIAKKNQNINLYSEPYEDATYTSVKSGELEVKGYVKNAYGNKWYVISGDKNKTYYVYENTFKKLYTQNSHYYENDYHRYDSGAVIEAPNTNNNGGNNTGLGNSIVGVVDIPSSWDNLSIRTGPSTNYQIVGSMNDGVRCNVYPSKTQNGWYYVEYNGIYGYASGKQINTSNSSAAATTSTPAGISLSTSNVNLDYPNSATKTITVSATGNLPNRYKFELSINSSLNYQWDSSWSGNSINLTVSANQNSASSSTATIYLKDSSNDSICASINFNINVTKPVVKEYVKVSFDSMGGSTDYASQTVEEYGTATIPSKKPSKIGYEFLGWSTDRNASVALYESGETINVGNTNLTFYAVWREEEASWDEWDLNVSKDELYFDNDDYEKTVLVRVDKQDAREFYFTLEYDEHFDAEFGDEWYDEHGYFCKEVIVSAPEQQVENNKITIRMRDENHNIVDSTGFYVYLEENQEVQFADRNPSGISVYLNGEKLSFDVQPQIINSRTMVPMRKIFESLGTVVGWNNNTQKAISVKKGDVVSVSIGGQYLTVNGEQKLLDSPPVIISGRTLVPVRAIAESFNCDVEWYDYGTSQVVDITMNDTINNMENKGGLVIGYSEFAPFSYFDENGYLIGFDTELAKYVCDFWGWDYSFVEIPFDMKFVAINSGEIDCYWNAITKTEERMEYATFTNDYVEYTFETEEDGEWYTSHEVHSVPFQKGDYDTVQLVNIALEEAQKDGTIEYLKYKYGIE